MPQMKFFLDRNTLADTEQTVISTLNYFFPFLDGNHETEFIRPSVGHKPITQLLARSTSAYEITCFILSLIRKKFFIWSYKRKDLITLSKENIIKLLPYKEENDVRKLLSCKEAIRS